MCICAVGFIVFRYRLNLEKPPLAQVVKLPALDDEVLPPVKKFPAAEEVAEPKSVDAPVELADCANALCTSCGPNIPTSPAATVPATKSNAIVDFFITTFFYGEFLHFIHFETKNSILIAIMNNSMKLSI